MYFIGGFGKIIIRRAVNKFRRDGLLLFIIALFKFPLELKYRLKYKKMLKVKNLQSKFSFIYENKIWFVNESLSGEGSELRYTETLRKWLISNLPNLKIKTFVDAPCGDFNWMRFVLPSLSLKYVGLDIVPSVIKKNKDLYASENIDFNIANICVDKLPECDLIMVRDCLFHFSFADINNFLKNLAKTNYKYLLTTTHIVESKYINRDITSGDSRFIDLFSSPFKFNRNKVIDYIDDYPKGVYNKRQMILIEKKHVPTKLHFK